MFITNAKAFPLTDAASFGMGVELEMQFDAPWEAPIRVDGVVRSATGKIVGVLATMPQVADGQGPGFGLDGASADSRASPVRNPLRFLVTLSREAIEHIQEVREKDGKRDVNLRVTAQVTFLKSAARSSHVSARDDLKVENVYQQVRSPEFRDMYFLTYKYEKDFHPAREDLWLLSGDNSPRFLVVMTQTSTAWFTISASDWTTDYAPTLGIGRFYSVELPSPPDVPVSGDLKKRLTASFQALATMQEDYRKGDWPELAQHARPVVELLNKEEVLRPILEADGYPPDAVDNFVRTVRSLYELTSKFLHRVGKGTHEVAPELKASREEAEFIFFLSLSALNMIATKARRSA